MVSIVIPVYNSGDFLRPCVDSIIAQTYNDWELLLVDDGSSDGSELACDEYAKKDVRIKVFHKSNQGATSARQFGVANARGEWVLFSDSDDILPAGSLEKLVSFADSSVDIVVGTVMYKNSNVLYATECEGRITPSQYICLLLDHKTQIGPVAKLIRKELFNGLKWLDYRITNHEDLYMLISLSAKSNRSVYVSNEEGYYICNDRPGTVSSRVMGYSGWRLLFESIEAQLNGRNEKEEMTAYIYYIFRTIRRMLIEKNTNYKNDEFIYHLSQLQEKYAFPANRNTRIVLNSWLRTAYIIFNSFRKKLY